MDRLQQVRIGSVGQLDIGTERCIEVREYLAGNRNPVITFTGQEVELLG
jgi:hypothetical protein